MAKHREDPLLAHFALPMSRAFFPSGFPILIRTNSTLALEAAEISWGGMRLAFDVPPIELRCMVSAGPPPTLRAPTIRARGNLYISVIDDANFACADLSTLHATAWVTEPVAANSGFFRYHVIESLIYSLLEMAHLATVHAACVVRSGKGVLLAGRSGAGKTSLAYTCARRGWTYVSDDASSLVRRSQGRVVIGKPHQFRFRDSAADLFPEFEGWRESEWARGKPTIEVLTALLPGIETGTSAEVEHIVFLNRRENGAGGAALTPVSKDEARERLWDEAYPPELEACQQRAAAVERLLDSGLHELSYGGLDDAVVLLEQLVADGR